MLDKLRDARINMINAVYIVLVLIWHIQPITPQVLPSEEIGEFWSIRTLKICIYI